MDVKSMPLEKQPSPLIVPSTTYLTPGKHSTTSSRDKSSSWIRQSVISLETVAPFPSGASISTRASFTRPSLSNICCNRMKRLCGLWATWSMKWKGLLSRLAGPHPEEAAAVFKLHGRRYAPEEYFRKVTEEEKGKLVAVRASESELSFLKSSYPFWFPFTYLQHFFVVKTWPLTGFGREIKHWNEKSPF